MAETDLHQSSSATNSALPLPAAGGTWTALCGLIATWQSRARQRRELADLEPWVLHDLGLTQSQAAQEAAKPFWRR